jgi:hypothetical protein
LPARAWCASAGSRCSRVATRRCRSVGIERQLGRAELPLVGDPHERVALLLDIATIEELVAGDLAHAHRA